jgi:hypothetical protein
MIILIETCDNRAAESHIALSTEDILTLSLCEVLPEDGEEDTGCRCANWKKTFTVQEGAFRDLPSSG